MAQIVDLLKDFKPEVAPMSGVWYAKIVAPHATTLADFVYVEIPDISTELKFGPCRWPKSETPDLGKDALVIFDNRQNPWVIQIW